MAGGGLEVVGEAGQVLMAEASPHHAYVAVAVEDGVARKSYLVHQTTDGVVAQRILHVERREPHAPVGHHLAREVQLIQVAPQPELPTGVDVGTVHEAGAEAPEDGWNHEYECMRPF